MVYKCIHNHTFVLSTFSIITFGTIVWKKNISQNIFSYFTQKKVTLFSNDFKISKVMTEFNFLVNYRFNMKCFCLAVFSQFLCSII